MSYKKKRSRKIFFLILSLSFIYMTNLMATNQQSANLKVVGVITDETGEKLIGVSIVEKGTTNGTVSNIDGKFELHVNPNAILIFTYIGYKPQSVKITKQENLRIALQENSRSLDEVVVVAYGTQKKANLTGSVSSVKFDDVASMPVANTTNILQGRMAGVVLTSNGAQAGNDTPEIRIRGIGTLSDYNDPMVVIDGVESSVSQISTIPANDIDNISVLKDAASASIYGVRAANGVILITTKKGTDQKPQLTYSGSIAIQEATVLPNYVNSYEWAKMYNETHNNRIYTKDMLKKIQDGSDPDHFANTDWAAAMFRTAPMQQHNLSVNGGTQKTHYMLSFQYLNQEGILRATANRRYNFRSNVDVQIGILKLGAILSGNKQDVDEPTMDVTGEGLMRCLSWFTRPTVPVKYSNGYYGCVDGSSISQSVFKNPVEALYKGKKDNQNYRFDGQTFGEINIFKGLKFRSSLAYKLFSNDVLTYNPRSSVYDAAGKVLAENTNNSFNKYHYLETTLNNENILTYNYKNDVHDLNVLVGHSIQASRTDVDSWSVENFPTDNLYVMSAGTENPSVSGNAYENSLQSLFGRINYNYNDRYLLEMNVRRDGSSRMPKVNRYAIFPSFSAGWILSNESFLTNIEWLSSLKLRGSWGKLGNQEIGNYAFSETMSIGANYYFDDNKLTGIYTSKIANDKIKWETTTITDFGVDASFWNRRISLTFDWFNKLTSDILLKLGLPSTFTGTSAVPYQNAGTVLNRGWELGANYLDKKGNFRWSAGFNISGIKNKIINNGGVDEISNSTINREGYAIRSFYGLQALGLYRTETDLNRTTMVNGQPKVITQFGEKPKLGDIMYKDVTGDGNITDEDRIIIGNPFPKLQYSFNIGFGWKNMDVTAFFQGVSGIYRYNWEQTTLSNGGNMTTRWLDRYSTDNINGSMPVLGDAYNDQYSSFWLTKADYLRLKSFEIGYTFNAHPRLVKIGINQLRIYLAGANLLTFSSLENFDPEKSSSDSRNDAHPNAKTYSFGINVKF